MSNYDWIKSGVKAELINGTIHPELNGEIVTISSGPEMIDCLNTDKASMCARVEESKELAKVYGCESLVIPVEKLKPFNPPNWEQLAATDSKVKCDDFSKSTLECKHNFDKSNQWIAEERWADER